MKLSNLRPFVPSGKDYQLSRQFFLDIGFKQNWGDDSLCELEFDGVRFLLQNFENIEMQQNLMIYVTVDDLDAWYQHLVNAKIAEHYPGVKFSPPEKRPWGVTEIHMIDPAGVCWHFG